MPNQAVTKPTSKAPASGALRLATLADLPIGSQARILEVAGGEAERRRLLEMGLCRDTDIEIVRRAPLGDPIEVRVRDYHLSLRMAQARQISVHQEATEGARNAVVPEAPGSTESVQLPDDRAAVIAIAGNPNCGKTTLFNALTGLRQRTANYPGVTVDKKEGTTDIGLGHHATIIDMPGTYSLTPVAPDERIAMQVAAGLRTDTAEPDLILAVVDATNLARNLFLLSQLSDLGRPLIVALNMIDVAKAQNQVPDVEALERLVGVPVVPISARTGEGVLGLVKRLGEARCPAQRTWCPVPALATAIEEIANALPESITASARPGIGSLLLTGGDPSAISGQTGDERLFAAIARSRRTLAEAGHDPLVAEIETRYRWIDGVVHAALGAGAAPTTSLTQRLDRFLLHPVLGLGIFGTVMWALFAVIYTAAAPLMDGSEALVSWVGDLVASLMGPGLLQDLWLDGIIAGVGGVLVFVPQIALLFLILAVLEESGYLARAAFLLDRPLTKVGLHGKSFIPMLSAHACAIPGVMSARSIENHRDRLVTSLVAPLATCGARLPVYALLIAFFFGGQPGWVQGSILMGLYLLGMVGAVAIALVLRLTLLKPSGTSFLMELSPYRLPRFNQVVRATGGAAWAFARKAGTVILVFTVLLWAAMRWPGPSQETINEIATTHGVPAAILSGETEADNTVDSNALAAAENDLAAAHLAGSTAGRIGRTIEPVIEPLGYDWQIGIGLLGSFAAREVFVGTMGVVYGAGVVDDETGGLQDRMATATRADGTPLWTPIIGISLLVWFAIAMQCISTTAIMRRETGGWRWPIAQLIGFNAIAYLICLVIWQVGSRL